MWQCIKCETFNADAHTACVVCSMQKRISLARQKEQQAEVQALEQRQKQEQQAEQKRLEEQRIKQEDVNLHTTSIPPSRYPTTPPSFVTAKKSSDARTPAASYSEVGTVMTAYPSEEKENADYQAFLAAESKRKKSSFLETLLILVAIACVLVLLGAFAYFLLLK